MTRINQTVHYSRRPAYIVDLPSALGLSRRGGTLNAPLVESSLYIFFQFSYSNHAMIGGWSAAMFPPNSLARAITDGMKNISGTPLSVLHGNIELDFVYR
jgi:hypothetical protein